MLSGMRRPPLVMVLLAVAALLATLIAPAAMAKAAPSAPAAAMAAMPGMAHPDAGGHAPCGRTCCIICQALPAPSEPARPFVAAVQPVEFARAPCEPHRSALLERSTPPPRLG